MHFMVVGKNESGRYQLCDLFRLSSVLQDKQKESYSKAEILDWVKSVMPDVTIVYPEDEASEVAFLRLDDVKKIEQDLNQTLLKNGMELGSLKIQSISEEKEEVTLKLLADDSSFTYVYQVGAGEVCPIAFRDWIMQLGLFAAKGALRDTLYVSLIALPLAYVVSRLIARRKRE